MSVALLVITDGRHDYLQQTVQSAEVNLYGEVVERWMYDDTGDDDYRSRLSLEFPTFHHINGGPRQGFGGAIQTSWSMLQQYSEAQFIWHAEQDFTFNRPVNLHLMTWVLNANPHLAQIALRRQAWNDAEKRAGGVIEQHPEDYTEHHLHGFGDAYADWLEHTKFWTTNPSLYRKSLLQLGWPDGPHSEGHFTQRCLGAGLRFAYWGKRSDQPAVEHIGHVRAGTNY